MLSHHIHYRCSIDRFVYLSHVVVFILSVTAWQSSLAIVAALHVEVECHYTIAWSAWCSAHQLPGCNCFGKFSRAPFGCVFTVYMAIYGYM